MTPAILRHYQNILGRCPAKDRHYQPNSHLNQSETQTRGQNSMKNIILLASTVIAMAGASAAVAQSRSEITVGYFLEWPMPFQFAKVNDTYEDKMGVTVNWRSFDTGTAMNAAMASGDVQISVSHGAPPVCHCDIGWPRPVHGRGGCRLLRE